MRTETYRKMHPLTATLNLSNKKYSAWLAVRWECVKNYIEGKDSTIWPCMVGEIWYKGQKYTF